MAPALAAAVRVLAGPHTAAGSAATAPLSSAAAGFARLRCGTVPTRARARNSQHVFKMWTGPWPWPPAGYVTCSCRNGKLCTQHRWGTPPPPCARATPPTCARATPARAARIRSALKFQLGVGLNVNKTQYKNKANGRYRPTRTTKFNANPGGGGGRGVAKLFPVILFAA